MKPLETEPNWSVNCIILNNVIVLGGREKIVKVVGAVLVSDLLKYCQGGWWCKMSLNGFFFLKAL